MKARALAILLGIAFGLVLAAPRASSPVAATTTIGAVASVGHAGGVAAPPILGPSVARPNPPPESPVACRLSAVARLCPLPIDLRDRVLLL